MNTSVPDQLLVSLAHAPLPPSLLDSVLGKAASISNELLDSAQQKISEVEKEEEDEKKNQEHPNGYNNSNVGNGREYAITHVILTGSPNVITPGKFIPDWETQWTSGEKVLAQFVENIGLNRFHRLSSKGKCRLKGRLVDINPWECSQFQAAKNGGTQRSHNYNINQSSVTVDEEDKENNTLSATTTVGPNLLDGMDSEFTRIANLILQLFIREEKFPIQNITILLPLEPRHSGEGIREDIVGMANDIFRKCWRDVAGPFNGVTPNIIIVDK